MHIGIVHCPGKYGFQQFASELLTKTEWISMPTGLIADLAKSVA